MRWTHFVLLLVLLSAPVQTLMAGTPVVVRAAEDPAVEDEDTPRHQQPSQPATPDYSKGRIITPEEVRKAAQPKRLLPLRIVGFPFAVLVRGMEKGLISYEKHHMRERMRLWQERIRELGFTPLFGGLGEGAGFGGGTIYTLPLRGAGSVNLLGRATFKRYQEFDLRWAFPMEKALLSFEASYQWRPQENFYGLGHESKKENRTAFALRQSWLGAKWEYQPVRRLRLGSGYQQAWTRAQPGEDSLFPSPDQLFPDLSGFNENLRLHHFGFFLEADFLQDDYQWGGRALAAASYQDAIGAKELEYFSYQFQAEGRLPVFEERSALVGQIQVDLNRERPGSAPIPFFLQPHIGGSSTLRGFALDRFYGRNLLLATLEYRYRIHSNMEAIFFYDEGQIFNRTSDLTWLNWHRNYGLGFKFKTVNGTLLGIEYGWGREGFALHITFGDRVPSPLGGPIRYGTYRR